MKPMNRIIAAICSLLTTGIVIDGLLSSRIMIQEAAAVIGRPLTPGSVAGVSRRTTRRVIRRSSIYVSTLPTGCSTVVIEGNTLSKCGGRYYRPYGNQYEIVNID